MIGIEKEKIIIFLAVLANLLLLTSMFLVLFGAELNSTTYWTHPEATLKFREIPGITLEYEKKQVPYYPITTSGAKPTKKEVIETYSFYKRGSGDKLVYIELISQSIDTKANLKNTSDIIEPNEKELVFLKDETTVVGKALSHNVYFYNFECENCSDDMAILLFETEVGFASRINLDEYGYISGSLNTSHKRLTKKILQNIQINRR